MSKPGALALFVLLSACGEPPSDDPPRACNGHALLCDRRVDEVVFPGTHNAHAAEAERFVAANQYSGLTIQLEDGIRAMMLDTYSTPSGTALCHGPCELGSRPLVDGLLELEAFLAAHPNEVLLLLFEDHATPQEMEAAFRESGLLERTHSQPLGAEWPTLGALVDSGRRVVAFAENKGGGLPWYHALFEHSWDNPYAAKTRDDLRCIGGRGDPGAPLFTLNHFLTNPVASAELAATINHDPFFSEHVERCREETGRLPNVIAVDYYELGDLFAVVRRLNGV